MSAHGIGRFLIPPHLILKRFQYRAFTSDTGLGQAAETRSRSVRIRNLPEGTQEGLLQQTLEKIALVKRVEVLMEQQEAVVELENAAVRCVL